MRRAIGLVFACVLSSPAAAHDGPPFLALEDAAFAGRTLTLYADPDVGTGTFFLYLDPAEGLSDLDLRVGARPADGRLPEASVSVEPCKGTPYQMIARVPFDRRGPWKLRFYVDGAGAEAAGSGELLLDVDVTPPGSLGPIDVVWFLAPFAAVAFLWIKALRQRRRGTLSPSPPTESQ